MSLWTKLAGLSNNAVFRKAVVGFSGSAAITAAGMLLSPVISRLYRPTDYGEYAVFSILLGNLSIVSSLNYLGALLLPKRHERFVALTQLSLWLSLIVSVSFLVLLWFFEDSILTFFDIHSIGSMVFWIPFILLASVLMSCLHSLSIRENQYSVKAVSDVSANMTGKGYNIAHALWFGPSPIGFIIGDLLNRAVAIGTVVFRLPSRLTLQMLRPLPLRLLVKTALFYRRFPLQVLPSTYLNIFSSQLPILMLKRYCDSAQVGSFAFATSMMELPISLLGGALSPVVMRDAVQAHHDGGIEQLAKFCSGYFRRIFLGLAIPFAGVAIFGDLIFPTVFGGQWKTAGVVACLLAGYYAFRLNYYIFVAVYTVIHKQIYDLLFNIVLLVARFAAIYFVVQSHGFLYAVGAYSAVSLVLTALNSYVLLGTLGIRSWKVALEQFSYFAALLGVLYLARLGLNNWLHLG
ncbi:oligosaccharide flippase family protein [Hymenobacter sp. ASUV-10]|uniref:Oligosaccharide flippase family protein n=1 Tax=Hymenobacter aranciens TaxID=3063996 RepID=A0ABT9B8W6_9BACT|nr:oligosaccharide flippase family protein [Hymenobacter sp. ASUV-10]MDO7874164.1 oligosaccharide flippase family protein [Hymenobacter sp. ASUV-10]